MGTFGVKRASDEYFCPSTVYNSNEKKKKGKKRKKRREEPRGIIITVIIIIKLVFCISCLVG